MRETTQSDQQPRIVRKLVTILAGDFVGFSRLMSQDEEGTARTLRAHRLLIDEIIELHGGSIFSTAGDSVLAEFSSPVEATRSAIEIQQALGPRNADLADDRRLVLRIGINLGDVIVRGKDLLGDAVNIAARLESIAEPGGIYISRSVCDQIEGKLDIHLHPLGAQHLKNIPRAVETYRVDARPVLSAPALSPLLPERGRLRRRLAAAGALVLLALSALGSIWWTVGPDLRPPSDAPSSSQLHWLSGEWVGILAREPISDPLYCSTPDSRCRVLQAPRIREDGAYKGLFGFPGRPGPAEINVHGDAVRIVTARVSIQVARKGDGVLEGTIVNERGIEGSIRFRRLKQEE